jgi:hypothetical protein
MKFVGTKNPFQNPLCMCPWQLQHYSDLIICQTYATWSKYYFYEIVDESLYSSFYFDCVCILTFDWSSWQRIGILKIPRLSCTSIYENLPSHKIQKIISFQIWCLFRAISWCGWRRQKMHNKFLSSFGNLAYTYTSSDT